MGKWLNYKLVTFFSLTLLNYNLLQLISLNYVFFMVSFSNRFQSSIWTEFVYVRYTWIGQITITSWTITIFSITSLNYQSCKSPLKICLCCGFIPQLLWNISIWIESITCIPCDPQSTLKNRFASTKCKEINMQTTWFRSERKWRKFPNVCLESLDNLHFLFFIFYGYLSCYHMTGKRTTIRYRFIRRQSRPRTTS